MCSHLMKIKSVRSNAPKYAYVPCGKCEECRRSQKSQWAFRLRCELDALWRKRWHIGFFTLTYSDECLPTLPKELFKDCREFKRVPCFSRSDCRIFIDNIRKRLNEDYGLKDDNRCRYMVCCEYGSHTKRPHMHGLIAFPSQVEPQKVFELIQGNWKKGHVFPRYIFGGVDSHGYRHKPFLLCGDVAKAANYAAKYCCKDLDFYDSIAGLNLYSDTKLYKSCMPNHIQSKSIGLSFLANKSNEELARLLRSGASFVGDLKTRALPLYIRNKILYSNDYVFEPQKNGDWTYDFCEDKWSYTKGKGQYKRLVRRVASKFFEDNVEQVYKQKVEYYAELFRQMSGTDFWTSRCDKDKFPELWRNVEKFGYRFSVRMKHYNFSPSSLAEYYVAYYGVPKDRCWFVELPKQYLSRYQKDFQVQIPPNTRLVDPRFLDSLNNVISLSISYLQFCQLYDLVKVAEVARVQDFFKHLT